MFCKNCGREIDQKTLKKLMEQRDGSVVCSKCKQPLDNAEMCGGFWGLVASSEEKEAAERSAVSRTVMLDDSGRPVQGSPRMQNRASSAVPESDLQFSAMSAGSSFASSDSRRTSGADRNTSSSYDRKGTETRVRRSGARKNTELWITRAVAALLGICLILSLVTKCSKSDDSKEKPADTAETTVEPQDDDDSGNSSAGSAGAFTGAPDEEPSTGDSGEDKQNQGENEQNQGETNETGGEEDQDQSDTSETAGIDASSDSAEAGTDNTADDSETEGGIGAGTDVQDSSDKIEYSYNKLERTIGIIVIDNKELNIQSFVQMIDKDKKYSNIGWYKNKSKDQISIEEGIKDGEIEKKYESEKTHTQKTLASYEYENGYLTSETRYSGGKTDEISYETLSDNQVLETHSEPQTVLDHNGNTVEYKYVIKTYAGDNSLDKIKYYKEYNEDEKAEPPVLSIDYKPDWVQLESGEYYNVEYYSDGTKYISIEGPGYEYNQIRYTYGSVPVGDTYKFRLLEMAYYYNDDRTAGPNGFSYFRCEYNENVRTDTFYDKGGKPVTVTAEEPFLSDTVIPAYYSYEFPYLAARPAGVSTEQDGNAAGSESQVESEDSYNSYTEEQYGGDSSPGGWRGGPDKYPGN